LKSTTYRELLKLNDKEASSPIQKQAKYLNRSFSKDIGMASRCLKITLLIIREMKIKTAKGNHFTPVWKAAIENKTGLGCSWW
jgi:hypothetical protein